MKRYADILLTAMLMMLASAWLTACSDSNDDGPADQLLEQIVTFIGNEGENAGFEYQAVDDSPVIHLTVNGNLNETEVSRGTRLLMRYRLPAETNPNSSGKVSLISLQRILTDTVTIASQPELSDLYLLTIQRSGEYLNIQAQMLNMKKRRLEVTATPHPDSDGLIDLYVNPVYDGDTLTAYPTDTKASLWIGPVWQRSDATGVRVHVANTNNIYRKEFVFKKQTL